MSISEFFAVLSLLVLVVGIVGLFSPRRALPFFRKPSRLKVILIYFLLLMIIGNLYEKTMTPEERKEQLLAEAQAGEEAKKAEAEEKAKVKAQEEAKKTEKEEEAKTKEEMKAKKAEEEAKTKEERIAKKAEEEAKAKAKKEAEAVETLNLAKQEFEKGNYEEADKKIKEALKLNPNLDQEATQLALAYKGNRVRDYMIKAREQMSNQKYKEAKTNLEKVVELDNGNAEAYALLGTARFNQAMRNENIIEYWSDIWNDVDESDDAEAFWVAHLVNLESDKLSEKLLSSAFLIKEEAELKLIKLDLNTAKKEIQSSKEELKRAVELGFDVKQEQEVFDAYSNIELYETMINNLYEFYDVEDDIIDFTGKTLKAIKKAGKAAEKDHDLISDAYALKGVIDYIKFEELVNKKAQVKSELSGVRNQINYLVENQ